MGLMYFKEARKFKLLESFVIDFSAKDYCFEVEYSKKTYKDNPSEIVFESCNKSGCIRVVNSITEDIFNHIKSVYEPFSKFFNKHKPIIEPQVNLKLNLDKPIDLQIPEKALSIIKEKYGNSILDHLG